MTKLFVMKTLRIISLFLLSIAIIQCTKEKILEERSTSLEITLKNSEVYQYDFNISGDEEGAEIIMQAKHAAKSEIIRDVSTNWSVVYLYQPEMNFTGNDTVQIETCTGGDGTMNSCTSDTVQFLFRVKN